MSISVQSANGAVWLKRDWSGVRATAERNPAQRDEPTVVDRKSAANAQDYTTDALRLAALRRDAAATAAARTARPHTAADDTLIAGRRRRDDEEGERAEDRA